MLDNIQLYYLDCMGITFWEQRQNSVSSKVIILGAHNSATDKTQQLLKNILKCLELNDQDIVLIDFKEENIQHKILELRPRAVFVVGFTEKNELRIISASVKAICLGIKIPVINLDLLRLLHFPIEKAKFYQDLLQVHHLICLNQVA